MNLLILDIKNEEFIQKLKQNKRLTTVVSRIDKPKLYPLPDFIVLDFDWVFVDNKREQTMIELAQKLHPQVKIYAVSEEWSKDLRKFAEWFGADNCISSEKMMKLVDMFESYI